MFYGGNTYLVYSSWDGANQCLWIACVTPSREPPVIHAKLMHLQADDERDRGRQRRQDLHAHAQLGDDRRERQRGPWFVIFTFRIPDSSDNPAAMLYYGGRTFLVYSASNCAGTGYELGRLELTGTAPLTASSWTKYGSPIFNSANGFVSNLDSGHITEY